MIAIALLTLAVQQTDSARLSAALDRALQNLATLEAAPLSRPVVERKAFAQNHAEALLDTVVLHRSWGGSALSSLRRRYPGSVLLLDYDARLATKQQRWNDALELRERMVRQTPADTAVQHAYAELLERAGRGEDAKRAYLRWFETTPENDAPFRALLRMNADYDDLLERVERIQVRLPDSRILMDHAIELLYKLGRSAQADSLIKALKGRTS